MVDRAMVKADGEFMKLKPTLHPSVVLKGDQLQPWDIPFAYYYYKKKHLMVDEARVAEYFTLLNTLPALLKIYEDFFVL